FDPEPSPKWKCLCDLLIDEIPEEVKKARNGSLNNTKILILCNDNKSCSQLNHLLTMGENKYLFYTALRRDLTINSVAWKYKKLNKPIKSDEKTNTRKDTENTIEQDDEDSDELNKSNYVLTLSQMAASDSLQKSKAINESMFEPISQIENLDITQLETERPIICIQTFKQNVRQIEIFETNKKDDEPKSKVYFLIHDKTVEEQSYLTSLRREKQAFELLIQTKSVSGQVKRTKEKPVVIVDMREFRSDLPALLHKKGINIEPVTIAIGDYILTPDICVERKSISDLIGSLNSGRLFAQCTQMCRNYSRPILLIEFDQNKPFNLQGSFVVSTDLDGADIQQKLQLLTIHFPRLKLVWSPSPYATAELFYELKQGKSNPNVEEALALSGDTTADDMNYERYNILVHDFVQKLPGVTTKNITRLMNRGISLDHLISLTQSSEAEETPTRVILRGNGLSDQRAA
ncbi:jg25658, partial [Pararge aegeria aegeria]